MTTKNLSKAELKLISLLLKEAAEQYSDHGCNDYYIDNSPANRKILIQLAKAFSDTQTEEENDIRDVESTPADQNLYTHDVRLMEYLALRCKEAIK